MSDTVTRDDGEDVKISVVGDSVFIETIDREKSKSFSINEPTLRRYAFEVGFEDEGIQSTIEDRDEREKFSNSLLKKIGLHLALYYDEPMAICNRSGMMIPPEEWAILKGGGAYSVAVAVANQCSKCGAEDSYVRKEQTRKQRESTRVPPKWKCEECGNVVTGMTTG